MLVRCGMRQPTVLQESVLKRERERERERERANGGANLPFLNYIVENLHHGSRLLLRKAIFLQPVDELERIKVMVSLVPGRSMEGSSERGALEPCLWRTRYPRAVCLRG